MTRTPGQEALTEAARLESARIYGQVLSEKAGVLPAVHADESDLVIDARRAVHDPNVIPLRRTS